MNEGIIGNIRKAVQKIDAVSNLQVKPVTNIVRKVEKAGNLGRPMKSFKQFTQKKKR